MKILITGGDGQVGSELKFLSFNYGTFNWVFTDKNDLDISNLDTLENKLDNISPDLIINCAAYTDVENAEIEIELSEILNHKAVDLISKWTYNNSRKLLHFSTDYVFDGSSENPITESNRTNPLNNYGLTKLNGDLACLKNNPKSIILRTSWIYSSYGHNFVKTMYKLMSKKKSIDVICDQFGSPTYAKDLAKFILKIIEEKKWVPGIYNYSNHGKVSWYNFANSIKELSGFKTEINKIYSENFKSTAKRPKYSLLDKSKIENVYGIKIPHYFESLKGCIKILKDET